MQTSLPDLPFPYRGIEVTLERSAVKTSPRMYPRTDLTTFTPWISFSNDIELAINDAMTSNNLTPGTQLTIGNALGRPSRVSNEESLRAHAHYELHPAVTSVMETLGIEGEFAFPGSGNVALIGDPDFSWIPRFHEFCLHPKLIVEYKTDWAADLKDLPAFFVKPKANRNINERQSVDALEQLYGYMMFNNNKHGLLTNWTRAWCLRRVETEKCKTLQYAGPIELDGSAPSPSMLKVWVGILLLAEKDWFYASPTFSPTPPNCFFGTTKSALKDQKKAIALAQNYAIIPTGGVYPRLKLDFRLCKFELSSARRSGLGWVVRTEFLQGNSNKPSLVVMCKIVDVAHNPTARSALEREACAYAALQDLQSKVIPRLYGYYEVWVFLHLLALEPVGDALPDEGMITPMLRKKMESALRCIHAAGYIHGDIACRHFCMKEGTVYLVDLEMSQKTGNQVEKEAEIQAIDML